MVSIKDVAALAGVSDKTVSRVVNGEPNVKPAMIKRVTDAIDELGYVPNQAARLVRTNRSRVIGVVTDVVSTTPKSVELIHGIQDAIGKTEYSLLIANTGNDPATEAKIWRTYREHRIDGVLYVTMYHRAVDFELSDQGIDTVLVNCFAPSARNVPAIVPDDYQGQFDATCHAINCGHRKIGYITLNPLILAAQLRGQGFRDAMAAHNLPVEPEWIIPGIVGPLERDEVCAFDAATRVLSLSADQRPTLLLAGNDEVAMQCLFAAHALGLSVPDDIAIIGYDDFRIISAQVVPPLTTVALPYYEIGARAANRLLGILAGDKADSCIEKVACPLVQGGTTLLRPGHSSKA